MKLSFFIFSRFIKSNRQSKFLNLISTISLIGICLGVATLLIALSIVSGFEKTLTKKIMDLDSHIKIFSVSHRLNFNFNEIKEIISKYDNQINYVSPFLTYTVLINSKQNSDGITLKGVENSEYVEKIKSNVIEGELNFDKKYQLVIGKSIAKRLFLKVGDRVTLISLKDFSKLSEDDFPEIEIFTISAIYESGITKYDDVIAFTDLKTAQEFLLQGEKDINGVDITLKNLDNIQDIVSEIRSNLKYPLYSQSIFEMHRGIFTWIELQKKPIPVALSMIIIVAVFNIISILLIMVIEKTSSIGILKSLGLKKIHIITLFLLQGFQISAYGIISGNILALTLMFLQSYFNIIKVPTSIYMVTNVPFDYSLEIFLMVSIITLILALLAALIPSYISSKISPLKAIKFQ